jgi:hypothetical protein
MLVYTPLGKFNVISKSLNDWLKKLEDDPFVRIGSYTDVPEIIQTLLSLVHNIDILGDRRIYHFSLDSYHNCYLVSSEQISGEYKMFDPIQKYTVKDLSS